MNSYTEIYYHFVWSTKFRQPLILAEFEARLHDKIRRKAQELGVHLYAVNGMADHIHVVCDLPPRLAAEAVMNGLKGSSSHFINHLDGGCFTLYWQEGYGAHTFFKAALSRVVAYVDNQKFHHAEGQLKPNLEFISRTSTSVFKVNRQVYRACRHAQCAGPEQRLPKRHTPCQLARRRYIPKEPKPKAEGE